MPGWSPLAVRIAVLPLVICGPVLRRTEKDSVSVWVAFRRAVSDIRLQIYDSPNPASADAPVFVSAPTATVALGDQFHVALVTADRPRPPLIGLLPQHVYGYNIVLGSENDADLAAPGVLSEVGSTVGGIGRITYGSFALPSFVLPAADVGGLRLVHGSCRKPHGGKTDALRALDTILTADHADPATRPQQLFLTGDQIYADDVADVLLYMVVDACAELLGWTEPLPGNPSAAALAVGARRATVNDAGFSTDDGKCHLIRLGEFYAMYALVWSDALWPDDPPDWDDVYPGQPKTASYRFPGEDLQVRGKDLELDTPVHAYFKKERPRIVEFARSLPLARKVLANIPSYMVFDDHEVTDDWYLTSSWTLRNLTPDSFTRRIIQNGLSAFAVFQAWGNMPAEFDPVLQRLAGLSARRGTVPDDWRRHGDALLSAPIPMAGGGIRLIGGQKWHFTIDFDAYRFIALDTRNHRNFAKGTGNPGLVDDLAVQIPPPGPARDLTLLVSGAPVIGHPLLEETLQPLKKKVFDAESVDFEFWASRRDSFEALLDRLSPYRRVLMLSGDVHYSFTATMQYWNRRGGTTVPSIFTQLCGSSLSNENDDTNKVADDFLFILEPRRLSEFVGWNSPGMYVFDVPSQLTLPVEGRPAIHKRGISISGTHVDLIITPGDWSYRIRFAKDDRRSVERGTPAPAPPPGEQQRLGYLHAHRGEWDGQRVAVGKDNVGAIRFPDWANTKQVVHELWYFPSHPDFTQAQPHTRHVIRMDLPPLNEAPG